MRHRDLLLTDCVMLANVVVRPSSSTDDTVLLGL